jgi:putative exporter of polyketide antibiotics
MFCLRRSDVKTKIPILILIVILSFVKCNSVDRVSVDKYERNSVLTVRKAVRADSGIYKIVLKNSSGTCEGVADVVVLGE